MVANEENQFKLAQWERQQKSEKGMKRGVDPLLQHLPSHMFGGGPRKYCVGVGKQERDRRGQCRCVNGLVTLLGIFLEPLRTHLRVIHTGHQGSQAVTTHLLSPVVEDHFGALSGPFGLPH